MRAAAVPDRKVSARVESVPSARARARVERSACPRFKPSSHSAPVVFTSRVHGAGSRPRIRVTFEKQKAITVQRWTWKRHRDGSDAARTRCPASKYRSPSAQTRTRGRSLDTLAHSPTGALHGAARYEVKPVMLALPLPSRSQKLSELAAARVESHFRFRRRARASRTPRARACAQSSRTECTVRYLLCVRSPARSLARSVSPLARRCVLHRRNYVENNVVADRTNAHAHSLARSLATRADRDASTPERRRVLARRRFTRRTARRRRRCASPAATLRAGERKPVAPSVGRAVGRERASERAGWQVTLLRTGPGHAGQVHSRVPLARFPLYVRANERAAEVCERAG